jgi:hypothetical protein
MGAMTRPVQVLVAACLVVAASACTTEDPTAVTSIPLVPTQPLVDTFGGTVPVGGISEQVFSIVQGNGQLDITLTGAAPSVVVGLGAGTYDKTTGCTLGANATRNVNAGSSPQLTFTGVPVGSYCVRVFDPGAAPGSFPSPVAYTVNVSHY